MKPLIPWIIPWKKSPSSRSVLASPVWLGLLAVCVASAEPTPVYDCDFNTTILNNLSGNYQLMENIYLNVSGRSPWSPIGSLDQPFNGTLDGNNRFIYGLNVITTGNNQPAGLFGFIREARVQRLVLDQPYVLSTGNGSPAGAVAGEMERSHVTDSINSFGQVRTEGHRSGTFSNYLYSSAGGLVGLMKHSSRVENNLNTGAVRTNGLYAYAGGAVGYADDRSDTTGNLNTGMVCTSGDDAHAGGAVGYVFSSTTTGNLNTGPVSTNGTDANAGGAVGYAFSSTTTGNLNIGPVSTNGTDANAGGAVGDALSSTTTGNLNTGPVRTNGDRADAGAAVGYAFSSTTTGNLNIGPVSTNGTDANAGGAVGDAFSSITTGNLNTGPVRTNGDRADAGAAVGYAFSSTTIGNLNIGPVSTNGTDANAGGAVGDAFSSTTTGNLNNGTIESAQGTVSQASLSVPTDGLGALLRATDWTAGDNGQFPMLKGLNAAYQDLRRMNGTQNGTNIFPEALNEFADSGSSVNASLFDQTVWNVRDGYLPFLKGISRQQAEQAGINCDLAGFACSEESVTTEPSAENCPAPQGSPVFQAYDNENQWLYVVIKPSLTSRNLVLARYHGTVLDEQFGQCGQVVYGPPGNLPDINDVNDFNDFNEINKGYPVTAGLLQQDSTDTHIYLIATYQAREIQLFDLALSEAKADQPRFTAHRRYVGLGAQVNAVISDSARLHVTGKIYSHVLMGRYQALALEAFAFAYETLPDEPEQGNALALSLDRAHLYVAGVHDLEPPYSVFLRKYDRSSLAFDTAFGVGGEQVVIETDRYDSQQSVAVYQEWVYVAASNARGDQLSIRRYDPDHGMMDGSFVVDEALPDALDNSDRRVARVALFTDDQYLHLVKYDQEGHIFAATYDGQREIHRTVKNPGFLNVAANGAANGVAMTDGKIYLAFEHSGGGCGIGAIEVVDVDMPFLSINTGQSGTGATQQFPTFH